MKCITLNLNVIILQVSLSFWLLDLLNYKNVLNVNSQFFFFYSILIWPLLQIYIFKYLKNKPLKQIAF